jgi:hypothetical protein
MWRPSYRFSGLLSSITSEMPLRHELISGHYMVLGLKSMILLSQESHFEKEKRCKQRECVIYSTKQ